MTFSLSPEPGEQVKDDSDVDDGASVIQTSPLNSTSVAGAVAGKPYVVIESKLKQVTDDALHSQVDAVPLNEYPSKQLVRESLNDMVPDFEATDGESILKWADSLAATVGDTYYLVGVGWVRDLLEELFKEGDWSKSVAIDQTKLQEEIKAKLASLSYRNKASEPVVMPITEEVWEYLQTSFGGGPEYAWTFYNIMNTRQDVTRSDVLSMVLKHYISIKVILSTHLDECKIMHVNNFMPIADFKKQVMESFDLEEEHPDTIRIHDFFQYNFGLRIDNSGKDTLKDVPIIHNNPIFVELPVFQPEFSRRRVYLIKPKAAAPTPSYGFQYRMAQTDEFQAGSAPVVQGGFGLRNLGNTCYMNSTLQCLSNIPVLREYFLTRSYEEEINKDNPLGYEGKLATGFASLLSMLWSSTDSGVISPGGFKKMIGKIKPEFAGSFQHDSQEFLSQVLDGLHEDLNRVKNKPYTENPEGDGRPDEVVAKEALETHKKRNNSIINDLFTGLFKSTVTCPDPSCNNVSVTFDPYMILPLPLEAAEQHYEVKSVVFVPAKISATNAIRAEHVICPKDGPSFLLRRLLEQKLTIQGETSLLLFRADGTLMTDIITDWEPLNANTGASQNIFAYELEKAEDFINLISPSASSWERALASTSLMNANEAGKDASPEEKQISLASAPEDIIGLKGCPLLVNDVWESAYQFNEVEQLLRFEVLEVSLMSKDDLKEYKSKLKSKSGEDAELVYLNANPKSTDGFAYIKVSVDTQENINSPEFRSSTTSETNFVLEGVYRFTQSKSIMLDTTAAATTRTKEVRSRVVSTASKTPPRMKPTESSKEVKLQRPSSRLNFGFLKRNKKKKKTAQLVQQYEEKIKPKKTKVDPMKKKKIMSERSEGSTSSEKSIPKETYDEMCTRATSLAPEGLEVSSGLVVGKIWLRPLGDTVQHSKKVPAKFVKYRPFKSYAAAEADPARAAFSLTLNFGKSHEACWGKFLNDTGFALGEIFIRRSRSRGWGEASAKNGKINADTHLLAEKATQDVKLVIMCNRIDAVDSFYTNTSAARKINFKAMPFVYVLPSAISETEFWYLLKEELSTYIEIEKTSSSVSLSDDVSEDEYFQTKLDTLTENLKIVRSNQRFSHTKQYVGYGKDKIESKVGKNLKQSSKTPLFLEQEDVTAYLVGIWSNPEEKAAMPDVLNLTRPSNILSLKPSKKPKAVNFYSAVELFSKSEKLSSMNSWYCSKCKKHQEAFKQLQIWSVPEVLVVQFKRFSQKEGKSIADKLDTAVDFPETVNLKDFVLNAKLSKDEQNFEYDLVAMTCHLGNGLTFGHYVAAARNSEDGCWYSYNDSQVNKISAEEMKRRYAKDGYVIFYIRKDLRPASWDTTSPAILKNEANIEIDSPQSFL